MKKNFTKLLFAVIFTAVLALCLSGCGREEISIDGLYVATFELNEGTLETSSSSVSEKINFAYHPGTYVIDPTTLNGYNLIRPDYEFTGWYTDPSCSEASKWDFANSVINTEKLTLYAGWQRAIKLTYTLYYIDETTNQQVSIGSYRVKSQDRFDDWQKIANNRAGYTPLGYYSDPECLTPWDSEYTHPGTDADLDVPVYVDYMEGIWTFVDNLSKLKSAIEQGKNVYLTSDIDCGGATVSFGRYSGEFNGNGHTVSNFKVEKIGTRIVYSAIFRALDSGAVIKDVSFTDVTYVITGLSNNINTMKMAALAVSCGNVTVTGVSVTGQIVTNYTGEFTHKDAYVYEHDNGTEAEIIGGSINVTVVSDN